MKISKCVKCDGTGYISIDEPFCKQCNGIGYDLSFIADKGKRKIWFYVFLVMRLKADIIRITDEILKDRVRFRIGDTARERLKNSKEALEKITVELQAKKGSL